MKINNKNKGVEENNKINVLQDEILDIVYMIFFVKINQLWYNINRSKYNCNRNSSPIT